jgi:hypothetical protein
MDQPVVNSIWIFNFFLVIDYFTFSYVNIMADITNRMDEK